MIGGNLCRCTGYQNIVASVHRAGQLIRAAEPTRAESAPAAGARAGDA
jgi:carbon-monoxide dehydrogenase small subunit